MKASKIILLLSAVITSVGFIIGEEYTVAVGLCLFFGSFAVYTYLKMLDIAPIEDDEHYGI